MTASTIYVQFADSTDEEIISVLASPQDPKFYPNQGTVLSDDPRYVAFYDNTPANPPSLKAGLVVPGQ
jgi:hypothetical protein